MWMSREVIFGDLGVQMTPRQPAGLDYDSYLVSDASDEGRHKEQVSGGLEANVCGLPHAL